MNNLEGKTETISKIFSSDFFFKIPDYQRPFSWDEENFNDLIDDLISSQEDQQYFLGTLVLHRQEERNSFNVVDGQQRLTTLLILLACLRDLITSDDYKRPLQRKIVQEESKVDGIPEKPRIEVKDRGIFRELVLTVEGTLTDKRAEDLTEPESRYVQAIKIFRTKLGSYSQSELQKFAGFLNQKCVVIYLSTSTFDDAFKLFTIVNDRGKQLRRIDILKAQNISPERVSIDSVRDRIAQEWESLEKDLGESILESLLYMIRLIYIKEKPQEDLLNEFEKKIFRKQLLTPGEKFIDEVASYGRLYQQLFQVLDYFPETDPNCIKFKSMMYIMNQEFEASEWRACLLFFARKFNGDNLYEFMLVIEKVYLADWVKSVRKDERFATYSKILISIDQHNSPRDVISAISYDRGSIIQSIKEKNFYGTSYAKYFLLRLEVLASEHDTYREYSAKSIEHVFPQKPKPGSVWASDPDYHEHQQVVNTIGNLLLLSKGKNSSASNHEFELKKEKYLKPRVSDYPRSAQIILEPVWTISKIKAKTAEIEGSVLTDP
jgi:hypothetical protein